MSAVERGHLAMRSLKRDPAYGHYVLTADEKKRRRARSSSEDAVEKLKQSNAMVIRHKGLPEMIIHRWGEWYFRQNSPAAETTSKVARTCSSYICSQAAEG